jgi:hypothetical protein
MAASAPEAAAKRHGSATNQARAFGMREIAPGKTIAVTIQVTELVRIFSSQSGRIIPRTYIILRKDIITRYHIIDSYAK